MRRVLVTGGAGFIGSHLVERLVERGARVAVLDDLSSGRERNLASVRDRIDFVRGDACDSEAVGGALRGADVVFHLAAVSSVARSLAEPIRSHDVNVGGTLRVLEASRQAGVRRLVFASSASVYGDAGPQAVDESTPPDPRSPYALQKLAAEMYCRQYAVLYGLETVVLRYFNVYGARQDPSAEYAGVVPRFAQACRRREAPRVYGDGKQTRDFAFVSDVVEASLRAAEASGAAGEVLNVGSGRPTGVLDLLTAMRECTGFEGEARFEPPRPGEVRFSAADVSRARELLGFEAKVSLVEGLRRTLAGDEALRDREEVER